MIRPASQTPISVGSVCEVGCCWSLALCDLLGVEPAVIQKLIGKPRWFLESGKTTESLHKIYGPLGFVWRDVGVVMRDLLVPKTGLFLVACEEHVFTVKNGKRLDRYGRLWSLNATLVEGYWEIPKKKFEMLLKRAKSLDENGVEVNPAPVALYQLWLSHSRLNHNWHQG